MKVTTARFVNKARGLRRRDAAGIFRGSLLAALLTAAGPTQLQAAGLLASDGANNDQFGIAVSQSGNRGLVGAHLDGIGSNFDQGSAYLFGNLDTALGTVTQSVKLIASDGAQRSQFGGAVSLSGSSALVGNSNTLNDLDAAYLFRDLDTATGTITENVKLIGSDTVSKDRFGNAVSLSGNYGLVGAKADDITTTYQGSAYLFRNLDTASGTINQSAKLIASDAAINDEFGFAVSLSGESALVGSWMDNNGTISDQGSAYVFRNLSTATGTINQNVKLLASDGAAFDRFGVSVSLAGSSGLVGSSEDDIGANVDQGSAYLFRNLDTATGTITESVKLLASDGGASQYFGRSVSQFGSTGLVGTGTQLGSAYLFLNLDTAAGTINENLKLTASDGVANDYFGTDVSLDGDQFLIGAWSKASGRGKAYSGSVSSLTTLDAGNTSKSTSFISFTSQEDWIIGQTTDGNQVTLSAGDTASVAAGGKLVAIGRNAGADNNRLIIDGTLTALQIQIGTSGNTGNVLQLGTGGATGTISAGSVIGNAGSLIFNRSVATTQGVHFSIAAITGSGSVQQVGTGTTTFNAANTYRGDTIIKAGTLKLDLAGGIPNSARIIVGDAGSSGTKLDVTTKTGGFTVGAAQTLLGIGQIDGNTLILGKHAPGNSPGLQTMNGNLGYGSGSQLNWELAANVSTDTLGLRGTNFDGVDVIGAGVLTIQAGVTSNLIFNAVGSTVDWSSPFWDSNHTWLVYDNLNAPSLATGSIFGTIDISPDSLGATLTDGTFTWSTIGNDVHLNFTAIPEPSTWVLGALSLLGLSVAPRRKKTSSGAAL